MPEAGSGPVPVGAGRGVLRVAGYLVPLALLVVVWVLSAPPWSGPDEAAHYIKALGSVSADPAGTAATWSEPEFRPTPQQARYFADTSRRFQLSPSLAPRIPTVPCFALHPQIDAACAEPRPPGGVQQISYVGTYPPVPYFLPGAFAHLAGSPTGGLRLARFAFAAEVLALVGAALAVLDRGGGPPIGVLLGIPPMTLSLAATLNSSSFEAASALLFMAALVRLVGDRPSRALAFVGMVGGACLAWSRPVGPLWICCGLVIAAVLGGRTGLRQLAQRGVGRGVPGLALALATAGALAWDVALGFGQGTGRASIVSSAHLVGRSAQSIFDQQIGVFGYLDTYLPHAVYGACQALAVLLVGAALVLGTKRDRWAILATIALFLIVELAFVVTTTNTGFAMVGRYFLAIWAFGGVLVGEVLRRRSHGSLSPGVFICIGGSVAYACLQAGSLAVAARRFGIGTARPWRLLGRTGWSPPAGWTLCAVLAALGGLGVIVMTTADAYRRRPALSASTTGPTRAPRRAGSGGG